MTFLLYRYNLYNTLWSTNNYTNRRLILILAVEFVLSKSTFVYGLLMQGKGKMTSDIIPVLQVEVTLNSCSRKTYLQISRCVIKKCLLVAYS